MAGSLKRTNPEAGRFTRGSNSGTFKCDVCGKTRQIANRESITDAKGNGVCTDCWDDAGLENAHSDGYHADEPDPNCPDCTATQTPKETPMTAKTATAPKTATAKAKAAAEIKATVAATTPKADPVAAAVTKVCGAHTRTPDAYCGKDLPLADFNKGSDKDGLDRLCKTCSAAWWAASKARSAAKKADATPKAEAKAPKAAATPKRDPGARPAIADEADAKRAAADAARLARVKAAVAAAALAENAAA